jgi:iron(III) transport system permease protein
MRGKLLSTTKIVVAVFFTVAVIVPLARMLVNIGQVDVASFISSPRLWQAAGNSVTVSAIAALIAIALAMLLAFCVTRSRMPFKEGFSVLLTLPMLIPSISHGMGLIILLGRNGFLTQLFGWNWSIYGFWGIVIGSVLYAFPLAFLMLRDILQYEDHSPYDAAAILGIPKWRQFLSITIPYLRKPMISVVFATFTVIITDYGVPLMVGGLYTTLPVMMYQEVIGLLDFGKGSVIGVILLLPALASFIIDVINKNEGNQTFAAAERTSSKSSLFKYLSILCCVVVGICVLLPIASFGVLTFVDKYPIDMSFTLSNISKTMNIGAGNFLRNSLLISLFAVIFGVLLSYATAYLTARSKGRRTRILHFIALASLAIPGIVLGLSYALFFQGTVIYGTLLILVVVNMVHFFASPYLMAYNSLNKVNQDLEDVGTTLGVHRFRIIRDVLVPQTLPTILEMASYFFVNSMMTISAVSFLSNSNTKPLAMMIPAFDGQMQLEKAALVSLMILLCNLLMRGVVALIKRTITRRNERNYG